MGRQNKQSIEDFGEDDMPCQCMVCQGWFDLHDGARHPTKDNLVICADCADGIQAQIDTEEEIHELQEIIADAEYTIKHAKERLNELGVKA